MRRFKIKLLLVLLCVIIGEMSLVLLTTLVQEYIYNGISYTKNQVPELITGGFLTFLAAVGAGVLSAIPSNRVLRIVPLILSLLVTMEVSYLIISEVTGDPIWFEVLAGFSLVAGIWLGYHGWFEISRSYRPKY